MSAGTHAPFTLLTSNENPLLKALSMYSLILFKFFDRNCFVTCFFESLDREYRIPWLGE